MACDVGPTRTPRTNGATECDVSGLRATRRTCTADTSQTKGRAVSLLGSWKKTREDDEERTKASERDGASIARRRAKRRGSRGRG